MKVRVLDNLQSDSALAMQWENLVRMNRASGFMQSLAWAEFKRRQGMSNVHLGLFSDSGELIGGANLFSAQDKRNAGIFVAPEGPVLPWHNEQVAHEGLLLLVKQAETFCQSHNVIALRVEPRLELASSSALLEFGRAPSDLVPRETLYLNVQSEKVLTDMHAKARYNIGLSSRRGVVVKQDDSDLAIRQFYLVMKEAASRDDFLLEPFQFFTVLWQTLRPIGMVKLLFAEHDGDVLGTLLLITYGERATYLYGGISNKKRNLMAGYALQWEAIKQARASGCVIYDFYGFDQFMTPGHSYARFSKFKSQFGGQPVRFIGAHDHYFLDSLADVVIKTVNEIESPICAGGFSCVS